MQWTHYPIFRPCITGISCIIIVATLLAYTASFDLFHAKQIGDAVLNYTCPDTTDTYYYPDPDNCAKYYTCYGGRRYAFTCATGLLWNPEKVYCDYPDRVDCSRRYVLCGDQPDGATADPTNCSFYYQCNNHRSQHCLCTFGRLWNDELKKCDDPENVSCSVVS